MAGDPTHPSGVVVEIVGLERGDCGRSCEEHDVCGSVVEEDTLLRLRKEQIVVDGVEETAVACYWVTDGIDRCRVGFLKRHMVKHARRFDGALVQVTRVLSDNPHLSNKAERKKYSNHGCALAAVVSSLSEKEDKGKTKEGKVAGGQGKARGRKAGEGEDKQGEERKEEGKACGVNTFSWKCEFCTYTNVDIVRRDCRMCGMARTAKKMKTGF